MAYLVKSYFKNDNVFLYFGTVVICMYLLGLVYGQLSNFISSVGRSTSIDDALQSLGDKYGDVLRDATLAYQLDKSGTLIKRDSDIAI